MKTTLYILSAIFMGFLLTGCEDVIELELEEGQKRLIVNGRITDSAGGYVEIYQTAPYFDKDENPRISGAQVRLYENGQLFTQLVEDTLAGRYKTALNGTVGNDYHIEVTIQGGDFDGTKVSSIPEELRRPLILDSVFQKLIEDQPFTEDGYYPHLSFADPVGLGDSFRLIKWRNDSIFDNPSDIFIQEDTFFDGIELREDSPFGALVLDSSPGKSGYTYKVEVSGITPGYREFMLLLFQQLVQVGSTFDPPPAPIVGNMRDSADVNNIVYGYFNTASPRVRSFKMQF